MYWLHAAQKLAFAKIHRNGSQAGLAAARMHAEAPPGHAGPHRLSDKISPSQPSSVGTEATCPVVVAHILARWRMPMVRPVCPMHLGGPFGWPRILDGEDEGDGMS